METGTVLYSVTNRCIDVHMGKTICPPSHCGGGEGGGGVRKNGA